MDLISCHNFKLDCWEEAEGRRELTIPSLNAQQLTSSQAITIPQQV